MTKLPKDWKPDKVKFKEPNSGNYITQALFLEHSYSPYAMYTTKEEHHEHNGVVYPSLKKLYTSFEDPLEYDFANEYLSGWKHWCRILDNKWCMKHIQEWRDELEIKIRSQAVKDIMDLSLNNDSFQAAKWLADRGWEKRGAGRPSKAEKQKESSMNTRIAEEFSADVKRMNNFKGH
jgi:hypothetical protein